MTDRQELDHIRDDRPGRDGYTRCGRVWTPATSGTLSRCPECWRQAYVSEPVMLCGSWPRMR